MRKKWHRKKRFPTLATLELQPFPQCMEITEKVAFNIASEASYVYIMKGQKFIKNAKIG